jgi:hypothetical protein
MNAQQQTVLDELPLPLGLKSRIFARLALAKRRRARTRFALQSLVFFFSGVSLVPLAQYAGSEFYASGFYDFATLLFSDRVAVLSSWQEFTLSLLESLPSIALLLMAAALITLVWSLRRAVINGKTAFTSLPQAI